MSTILSKKLSYPLLYCYIQVPHVRETGRNDISENLFPGVLSVESKFVKMTFFHETQKLGSPRN